MSPSKWGQRLSRRHLVVLLLTVLFGVGLWYVMYRTSGFASLQQTDTRLKIEYLNVTNDPQSPQHVKISGKTTIPSEVRLLVNGLIYDSARKTDAEGKFSFDDVIIGNWKNTVRVEASTVVNWRRFEDPCEKNSCQKSFYLTQGIITGTVKDRPDSIINSAIVTVTNPAEPDKPALVTRTNVKGTFHIPEIKAGTYTITIYKVGFKPLTRNVELNKPNGFISRDDYLLEPGEQNNAAAPPVQSNVQQVEEIFQPLTFDQKNYLKIVERNVIADIKYRELVLTVEITLRPEDKRINLLSNYGEDKSNNRFINATCGSFNIKGHTLKQFSWSIERSQKNGNHFIRARSKPQHIMFSNGFDQRWIVETGWRADESENNILRVNVGDYEVRRIATVGADELNQYKKAGDDDAVLQRLGQQIPGDARQAEIKNPAHNEGIVIMLDYPPLRNYRQVLFSSVYDLLPPATYPVVYLLLGILLVVPVIWLLWFLEKHKTLPWLQDDFIHRFRRFSSLLLAIAFYEPLRILGDTIASQVLYKPGVDYSLSPFQESMAAFFRPLRKLIELLFPYRASSILESSSDLRLQLFSIFIIGAVAGVLWLILKPAEKPEWLLWPKKVLEGIVLSVILNLIVIIIIGVTLSFVPFNVMGLSQILPMIFAGVILILLWLMLASTEGQFTQSRLLRRPLVLTLFILLLIFLAYPAAPFNIFDTPILRLVGTIRTSLSDFFGFIQPAIPYLALPWLAFILKKEDEISEEQLRKATGEQVERDMNESKKRLFSLGTLLFAAYIIKATYVWLLFPLSLIVGIWIFRRKLMRPSPEQIGFDRIRADVCANRKEWFDDAQDMLKAIELKNELEDKKDITPEEYEKQKAERENYIKKLEDKRPLAAGITLESVVLNIGPKPTNWENGLWALKRGFVIALLVMIPSLLLNMSSIPSGILHMEVPNYALLALGIQLLMTLLYWLVAAFFFGYFFTYLKGETGMKKGLYVALAVWFCILPSDLILNMGRFLWHVLELIIFFILLGTWGFDYKNLKETFEDKFRWKKFLQFENSSILNSLFRIMGSTIGLFVGTILFNVITISLVLIRPDIAALLRK